MGKWLYRKPEPRHIRGLCVKCGTNPQKPRGNGFRSLCVSCEKILWPTPELYKPTNKLVTKHYRTYKEDTCSRCGFVPEHSCQLDVDHIDGDHSNNDPSNLQTLCANCHRLKTREDHINKKTPLSGSL